MKYTTFGNSSATGNVSCNRYNLSQHGIQYYWSTTWSYSSPMVMHQVGFPIHPPIRMEGHVNPHLRTVNKSGLFM